jgi:hypothetical protein
VLADEDGDGGGGEQVDAGCRVGVVTDDVAEAEHGVGADVADGAEHGAQCLEVGVDVGDDCEAHGVVGTPWMEGASCARLVPRFDGFEALRALGGVRGPPPRVANGRDVER